MERPQTSRWIHRRFPELLALPTARERDAVLTAVSDELITYNWRFWTYVIGMALLVLVGLPLAAPYVAAAARSAGLPQWTAGVLFGTVPQVLYIVSLTALWYFPARRAVRRELTRRGAPVCERCGYDCRGLTVARCPECGTPYAGPLVDPPA